MLRYLLAALLLPLIAAPSAAKAQSVADFYRGKTMSFLIGYPPGNGYDAYARLLIRHLGAHIPGTPTVIPENMPGAGSMVMINHLYNVAAKDGTVIGLPARNLVVEPLFGNAQAKFDPQKFSWLGSMNKDTSVCVAWAKTGVKTIDDVKKRELTVAATGQASDSFLLPTLINAVLGTRFKTILGYPDGSAANLALERGEVEGFCTSYAAIQSSRPQWLTEQQVNVVAVLGMSKLADRPDVPLVMDFAKDEGERQAMALVFASQEMGRPVAGPPGMPGDRIAALRKAFDDTMKDPELIAEAKRSRFAIDPITGSEVDVLIKRLYATPKPIVDKVMAIRPAG